MAYQEQFRVADGLQAWQSSQDLPWVKSAGLLAFYDDLSTDVKAEWCGEFTRSLTILPEDEGFLTGTMDNVRVIWNGAYLYDFFRWTGEGVSAWIPACAVAKPVLVDWIGNACPEAYSLFDTHAIAQVKDGEMATRVRGIGAAIFFRQNPRYIRKDHLQIVMLADASVHVNWGMIFHKSLVDELRHVAKKLMGPTPIGPFLTKYIQRWFDYLDKNQKSPPIGQIQDVFARLEMSR
jgi:hypothetical protein